MGMLLIGSPQYLARVRPGRTQQAFIIHTGDYICKFSVTIFLPELRLIWFNSLGKNYCPYFYLHLFRSLVKVYCLIFTYVFTNPAFALFKIKTAFINICNKRYCLCKIYMYSFIL